MKKISGLLLFISFLLAACNSPAAPEVVEPTLGDSDPPAQASPVSAASNPAPSSGSITPATTLIEAAVLREQDHFRGAVDPLVTIIEYGDYQ